MAKTVLELAVGTGQWDAGLKKAKSALDNFVSAQGGLKTALEQDSEKVRTFVQMMGRMESTAKTAKGQMNEYKAVIEQLTMQYSKLTDEQKKTIGQDYLKSIDQLKAKYKDAKGELDELNKSLGDTSKESKEAGSALDVLTNKFGISTKSLMGWGTALAAGKVALDVAKDAFFYNEEQLDEWGRVVEASQSVYEGFLNALNNGDIGGFLANITNITAAARNAYDALDALSTFNAFNQVNVERTRTAMTESIVDYREGNGSKGAVRSAGDAYKKELQERQRMERDAYEAAIKELAAKRNVDAGLLRAAMSGTYGQYQDLKNAPITGSRSTVRTNMYGMQWAETTPVAANERERLGQVLRQLNDTELQSLQALGAQAERTGNEIAQVDRQLTRVLNGRNGVGGGGGTRGGTADKMVEGGIKGVQDMGVERIRTTESMRELQAQLAQFTQALATATNAADARAAQAGIAQTQRRIGAQANALRLGISTDSMLEMEDEVKAFADELKKKMPRLEFTVSGNITSAAKEAKAGWTEAARAIQSVGGALQTIEDPAAKIAGIVGQAIANIALGFATATAKDSKFGVFGWIAAVAGGLATMVSTIAAIKSATAGSYEQGGIVPGNSYHGDHLTAAVNSGEVILSMAQSDNLVANMQGMWQSQRIQMEAVISGEQIMLVQNNRGLRTGRGEIVQSRRVRQ